MMCCMVATEEAGEEQAEEPTASACDACDWL